MDVGERMIIPCAGGPAMCRLTTFPPPLQLDAGDGLYVLVDDGDPSGWWYEFVPVSRLS